MPGFNDAHVHLLSAGSQKALQVDLDGTRSLTEMQSRIRAYVARLPASAKANTWIEGAGWDHTLWPGKTLPSRADLDSVTGSHPALFFRTDGHILVANSAALAAAGITDHTPEPAGGKIDRDAAGSPTGIVRETPATSLLTRVVPPPTTEQRQLAFTTAIDDALAHGVTSVQDYSPEWANFLLLESLEHTGKLHLRISEWQDFNLPVAVLESRRSSHSPDDPLLHLGQLKAFMDGSLGSRTAALEAPYTDDPSNSGIPRYTQDDLNHLASERTARGFQLGFHAIGDRANSMALDAFHAAEQTAAAAPHPNADAAIVTSDAVPHDLRLRIEHAQVLLPDDFDRFATLGVIASMQPSHLLTDMNWAAARLGPERVQYAYAWRSFLQHGVTLAFGTDYPVESINPFRGLYASVTRQNEAGTQTFQPQERISIREALYAYTQAPAFAEFRERSLGRLEPGFLADLVVLDRDPLGAAPQELLHTRVLRTFVNGKTVYSAPATR
jgi:predicted amidohydrolase YtcJ